MKLAGMDIAQVDTGLLQNGRTDAIHAGIGDFKFIIWLVVMNPVVVQLS
jgi:hypothetical protein